MFVRDSLFRIVIKLDTFLCRFILEEGSDLTKIFGVMEKAIEEDAFFHVGPNVDVAAFFFVDEWIINLKAEESVAVGCVELLFVGVLVGKEMSSCE